MMSWVMWLEEMRLNCAKIHSNITKTAGAMTDATKTIICTKIIYAIIMIRDINVEVRLVCGAVKYLSTGNIKKGRAMRILHSYNLGYD